MSPILNIPPHNYISDSPDKVWSPVGSCRYFSDTSQILHKSGVVPFRPTAWPVVTTQSSLVFFVIKSCLAGVSPPCCQSWFALSLAYPLWVLPIASLACWRSSLLLVLPGLVLVSPVASLTRYEACLLPVLRSSLLLVLPGLVLVSPVASLTRYEACLLPVLPMARYCSFATQSGPQFPW